MTSGTGSTVTYSPLHASSPSPYSFPPSQYTSRVPRRRRRQVQGGICAGSGHELLRRTSSRTAVSTPVAALRCRLPKPPRALPLPQPARAPPAPPVPKRGRSWWLSMTREGRSSSSQLHSSGGLGLVPSHGGGRCPGAVTGFARGAAAGLLGWHSPLRPLDPACGGGGTPTQ
jgi:hypothetical protein